MAFGKMKKNGTMYYEQGEYNSYTKALKAARRTKRKYGGRYQIKRYPTGKTILYTVWTTRYARSW